MEPIIAAAVNRPIHFSELMPGPNGRVIQMDKRALAMCRSAFAVDMLAKEGIADDALLHAFATVPRERFLGPPPWKMAHWGGYVEVPSSDPAAVYQDALFVLQHERLVNNGSPSLHARGLHRLTLRHGDRVCHIGAGSGYYTALIASIVGPHGRISAVEFDEELAERARDNLKDYSNVDVICGNGHEWPRDVADAIYVNFAVHRPADPWIERLNVGGRLIFPLGVPDVDGDGGSTGLSSYAGFFLVERRLQGYAVEFLGPVAFVWGEATTGTFESYRTLEAAFRKGGMQGIRALRWKASPRPEEWYTQPDWGLVSDP
jgi:protein-L-isoaspartate(D-aspartate) O-methyltransferase